MAAKTREAGIGRYLKEAFLYRWNLLLFGGAVVAGVLSGRPDVVLPMIGAAELAYLAGVTSIPKFRAAIDAKEHGERNPQKASTPKGKQKLLGDVLTGLEREQRHRFQLLRTRCLEMRRIAHGSRGARGDDARTPALDRLLWAFLRLLFAEQALGRFLDTTDADAIRKNLQGVQKRQATATEKDEDERIRRSLADSIATAEMRLSNYEKAETNAEFVNVELDRIEGKIQALTEMAVSHQDPDYISSQVDSVAESMVHTEKAIRDLNYITGLTGELEETAPEILETDLAEVLEA